MACSNAADSATWLSGRILARARHFGDSALARLSLGLMATAMLSGCLVEDPPEYTAPTRTPPRLNLTQTLPPIDQIRVAQLDEVVDFQIAVSSEDAGVLVRGYLMIDYRGGVEWSTWAGDFVPASTLADDTRKLNFHPTVTQERFGGEDATGCHRITLRVAHGDSFDYSHLPVVTNQEDVAEAYWWLNVIDPSSGQDGSVLVGCP
jgi:hypothetical protein